MKLRLLVLGLLFLAAGEAHAAIATKTNFSCGQTDGTTVSCTASAGAIAVGDFIVIFSATPFDFVTSNCGGLTFSKPALTSGQAWAAFMVAGPATTAASACAVTSTRAAGTNYFYNWVGEVFTGVARAGQYWGAYSGPSTASPMTCPNKAFIDGIKPNTVGDVIVAAFKTNGAGADPWVGSFASTGSFGVGSSTTSVQSTTKLGSDLRHGYSVLALYYAPVVSAMVHASVTPYTVLTWSVQSGATPMSCTGMGTLELIASTAAGTPITQMAQLSDATKDVILANPNGVIYVLPANGLSSNWCVWVMSIDANSYIEPQAGTQLNGGTVDILLPPWQKVRVCQGAGAGAAATTRGRR